MALPIHLRLERNASGFTASAFEPTGRLACYAEGTSKASVIDDIEFRLIVCLERPFVLYLDDRALPVLRIVLEEIAICGIWVATAFDEDRVEVSSGECCCSQGAIDKCLLAAGNVLDNGGYELVVDVLDPNDS